MKVVIQRVSEASVTIDGQIHGEIKKGFLLLVGIQDADNEEIIQKMADKIYRMRIFEDENEKMNLSLAGEKHHAEKMYLYFNEYMRSLGIKVDEGIFGADMKVRLLNDGPVTIILDSSEW